MRVYTKAVYNWTGTGYALDELASTFDYYIGLLDACKESDAEKQQRTQLEAAQTQAAQGYYNQLPWQQSMAQQQMDLYNKQMQAQIGFQNQYMQQQQDQYKQYMALMTDSESRQKALQGTVTDAMSPYLKGDIGYSDAQMKALNTQGMSQTAAGYSDAESNLRAALLAHGEGGGQPLSGEAIGNMAELQAGLANQTSSMRNSNLLSSYNQALANKFNAAGVLGNVASQVGTNIGIGATGTNAATAGFGQGANSYAVAPVAQMPGAPATLAPKPQPGFWSGLASSFANGLGGGLASFGLGGLTSLGDMAGSSIQNRGLMNMASAPLW